MRNASRLLAANVFAQAVGLLIYPVLSRLFSADDFGLFNLFLSIGGIAVLFATGQYEYAVVLPHTDRQAVWGFHCGLLAALAVTALCLLSLPFSTAISALFRTPSLGDYLWLLPLYVFVMALWTMVNYWLNRHRLFNHVAAYQVNQSLLSAAMKLAAGHWRVAGGLIYGSVFAPLLALLTSLWRMPRQLRRLLAQFNWRGVKAAAARYRNFPLFSLPKSLADSLSGNLPMLVMAPAFGLATVGYIGMGLTLAHRPIHVLCNSVNQVFFPRAAELVRSRQRLRPLLWRYTKTMLLVAVPLFAALYFVLPQLCSWLLGDGWQVVGSYIRAMLPWLLLVLVSNAINFIPDLFNRQRGLFLFSLLRLSMQVVALVAGIATGDAMLTAWLYFSAAAVVLLCQLLWFRHLIITYERQATAA